MSETGGSDFLVMEQLLAQLDSETSAAEADGALSGLAAMLGADALPVWLGQLAAAPEAEAEARVQAAAQQLLQLASERLDRLQAAQTLPALCLPDDGDDLRDRTDSLVHWSSGFLAGLAEGAALRGTPARDRLQQPPLDELLKDLTDITHAAVSDEDLEAEAEVLENAYAELVEFLRVACQLTYESLADLREQATPNHDQIH